MISMMVGIEKAEEGDAWINSSSVTFDLAAARRDIGLCPQFDALNDNLTGREHLIMFAMIRSASPTHGAGADGLTGASPPGS